MFDQSKTTKTASSQKKENSSRSSASSIESVVEGLVKGRIRKVVVLMGAGVSTSSGIPDFRSPGTGLYNNLTQYGLPNPEAAFEINYFKRNPKPFFTLAHEIYPCGRYRPNFAHYFMRQLSDRGYLHRIYTQNIDGLERLAGVPEPKLIEAHGSFATASCIKCKQQHCSDSVRMTILNSKIPLCSKLHCNGLVKPDIVFFGEDLPRVFYRNRLDLIQADLLLVMGTSLEVEPFASIVDRVHSCVPRILFNRTCVGPFCKRTRRRNDILMLGDINEELRLFTDKLGWTDDIESIMLSEAYKFQNGAGNNNQQDSKTSADSRRQSPTNKPESSADIELGAVANGLEKLDISASRIVPHQSVNSRQSRHKTSTTAKTAKSFLKERQLTSSAAKKEKTAISLPPPISVDKYTGRFGNTIGNRSIVTSKDRLKDEWSNSSIDTSSSSDSDG